MPSEPTLPQPWRQRLLFGVMLSLFALLGWRVVHLQTVEHDRLRAQGEARHLRELTVMPQRGSIIDRNGQVLTVSTPVTSLWAEPAVFCVAEARWKSLLAQIKVTAKQLRTNCAKYRTLDFMYIQRRLPPMLAQQIMELQIPGVETQQEYKRYYPGGPVGAHLVGFTNIDDVGQEGLENAYDALLSGAAGRIRMLKDRVGNFVESVESIQPVRHGKKLIISIDQRIQSLASAYLAAAVQTHKGVSGSVVVVAVPSGEILAMVTSPQFNPNDRNTVTPNTFRNRSVTDVIEPGSTAKPFTAAMALESGAMNANTLIDTAPGYHEIGGHVIHDTRNHGKISVRDVVARSSNVGIAKIAMEFSYNGLFDTFRSVGFGRRAANLPGESAGILKRRRHPLEHASLAYGYGLSVTPLQLARAYTVFATDGQLLPVTLMRKPPGYRASGRRVFSAKTARAVRAMLELATSRKGTAYKARIPRYRVGGKTGTTHKLLDGSYENQRYQSVFAGLAPVTAPKFVMVVAVDDPRGALYYGGDVAAPVFAKLMEDLLRLYNIKPDAAANT